MKYIRLKIAPPSFYLVSTHFATGQSDGFVGAAAVPVCTQSYLLASLAIFRTGLLSRKDVLLANDGRDLSPGSGSTPDDDEDAAAAAVVAVLIVSLAFSRNDRRRDSCRETAWRRRPCSGGDSPSRGSSGTTGVAAACDI